MSNINNELISIETIAAKLDKIDLSVDFEVDIEGQRIDLFAQTKNGTTIAVIVKQWKHLNELMLQKAAKEVQLFLTNTNLDHVFIIIPSLPNEKQCELIYNIDGFISAVKHILDLEPDFSVRGKPHLNDKKSSKPAKKRIFVAMPFDIQLEDTYYLGILPAAKVVSASCIRVDHQYIDGPILTYTHNEIRQADIVVADLTDNNINVIYELGFAHALKKPIVHISASPLQQLPFDLSQWQTIKYSHGQVHVLQKELSKILKKVIKNN